MKKFLLALPIVLLIAAGCNATQQTSVDNKAPTGGRGETAASIKPTDDVDNLVNILNAQAQAQADSAIGSDQDLVTSDSATINDYTNVK